MSGARETTTVNVDGYTRFCLSALVVLLTVLIIGMWATGPIQVAGQTAAAPAPPPKTDRDVLPNAGAQRLAMLEAIRTTNGKLDKIISLLESGKLQVTITEPPPGKEGPANVKKPAAK